jgi:phosphoglucan, water dikinase
VQPLDPFVIELAEMSRERRSWRRRLGWVRDAVVLGGTARDENELAYLAIYLELVGTGAVACAEDGGHYRPNHHAALGLEIETALLGQESGEHRQLVRSILRWLPSHEARFRHAEPLTRIRDLAHRSDIPRELKQELKHRLQNKLHRSAGPEDLATATEILRRVTATDATLPPSFVGEYRIFCDELADFFGAASLVRDLEAILPSLGQDEAALARELRGGISRIDEELALIGRLRRALAPAWRAAGDPIDQRRRLVDLKLEERAVVLFSQRANQLESEGTDFGSAIRLAALVAEELALSGVDPEHWQILGRALDELGAAFDQTSTDCLLRARARFETLRVVVGWYVDRELARFAARARDLGEALGLEPYVAREFAERRIRGSLGFQAARLGDWALGAIGHALGLGPWQAVVPGTAEGRLLVADRLGELDVGDEPLVVLLRHLEGDEEIPPRVRALLVLHDVAYLSHVAIRARQSRVVLGVHRDGKGAESEIEEHAGKLTRIDLGQAGLTLGPAAPSVRSSEPVRVPGALGPVVISKEPRVIDLAEAELATSGAKAWGARRLCELSADGRRGFRAPRGLVVPFGAMRASLGENPEIERTYASLLEVLSRSCGAERDRIAGELRTLIQELPLGGAWLGELTRRLGDVTSVAVRSSSNAEDLPGLSGAGLHDSVLGVRPAEIGPALGRVWASLFGPRAVGARRSLGIPDSEVEMALLVEGMVPAELSFVMYTRSPLATGIDEAYVELAVGLGEMLTSGSGQGSPYRFCVDRRNRSHRLGAHASYPDALFRSPEGSIERRVVDYTEIPFGQRPARREAIARRLADLADLLEPALGGPQDVEGAFVGDELWVLQSRPGE